MQCLKNIIKRVKLHQSGQSSLNMRHSSELPGKVDERFFKRGNINIYETGPVSADTAEKCGMQVPPKTTQQKTSSLP
jgi:hypothetical protein